PGPLTDDGRRLLDVMSGLNLTLDLSHASEETFFEAIDRFEGAVIVSHANPRALLNPEPRHPERHLSDDMIRRLAERGGVVGLVPLNRFIKSGWQPADGRRTVTLEHVAAMIDYVCQLTGSAGHVGIGSDFDGTFGRESTPAEIDTVADLALVGDVLKRRGYTESQVAGVLADNWLRVLRRGLPA
ncbi:MAG: membrane dipeptidase, partial [Chloroflexi bacterium]|nr:membrane dipeptidase [Chloroflexota bacterium]